MKEIKPITVGIIIAIMLVAYLILSATAPREPETPPTPPAKPPAKPETPPATARVVPAVEANLKTDAALEAVHGSTT